MISTWGVKWGVSLKMNPWNLRIWIPQFSRNPTYHLFSGNQVKLNWYLYIYIYIYITYHFLRGSPGYTQKIRPPNIQTSKPSPKPTETEGPGSNHLRMWIAGFGELLDKYVSWHIDTGWNNSRIRSPLILTSNSIIVSWQMTVGKTRFAEELRWHWYSADRLVWFQNVLG